MLAYLVKNMITCSWQCAALLGDHACCSSLTALARKNKLPPPCKNGQATRRPLARHSQFCTSRPQRSLCETQSWMSLQELHYDPCSSQKTKLSLQAASVPLTHNHPRHALVSPLCRGCRVPRPDSAPVLGSRGRRICTCPTTQCRRDGVSAAGLSVWAMSYEAI